MRKLKFFFAAFALLFGILLIGGVPNTAYAASNEYYLGGMTAGFSLSAGGAEIIGLSEVCAEDGVHRPAEEVGLKVGDLICAADGIKINSIEDMNRTLGKCGGKQIRFTIKRDGEKADVDILPVKDKKSGKFKIGVIIRDTLTGIGTVTYIKKDTLEFGSLGHAVCDENNQSLGISDARVYLCSIIGVNRGKRGKAGELRGLFMNDRKIAKAEAVLPTGLYGTFEKGYDFSHSETVETAPLSDATIGKATIYSTIDGICPQMYEINIVKVDADNKENKNFVIKVTDEKLIEETGGIVQGMSGSPIVQNGKLIGAVTHVFLNDPTRGYGIGIENMLRK